MKKTLEELCLLAIAGAVLLCFFALLIAIFQGPNTAGVASSSGSGFGGAAANFVENHHNAVIASAIFLLLLVPVGWKFLPRLRLRRRVLRADVETVGMRMSPYSVPNDSLLMDPNDSILKPEYRSGYAKTRGVSSSSLVGNRKAS